MDSHFIFFKSNDRKNSGGGDTKFFIYKLNKNKFETKL